ncbi:MAG: CubicO group peptidase (beta-lactamase class C family) [Alphaproteobacteria bacterium]|jgi:CubicO group peptidase (beta-lactamase class C family)
MCQTNHERLYITQDKWNQMIDHGKWQKYITNSFIVNVFFGFITRLLGKSVIKRDASWGNWQRLFFVIAIILLPHRHVLANDNPQLMLDDEKPAISMSLSTRDISEVEAFVDKLVNKEIAKHSVPGVTVSIVKDGEIVLLKGYGFADLGKQLQVNPKTSMFKVGSITKTMTALAVMQLVEQGELALDTDVNKYLSAFKIPQTFKEPITIRALLSHRAGFEVADAGNLFAANSSKVVSTQEFLATRMPKRIWPPGLNVSYSNYGFGLLGYLVEQKSGLDLATYMQRHIFAPLGMQNTTLQEPLTNNDGLKPISAELAQQLTIGYFQDNKGENLAKPFVFMSQIAGAGGVTSSTYDMALYMIARMDNDKYSGGNLVNTYTSRDMKQRLYNDRPLATGIMYGMFDGQYRGYERLSHGGGTPTFLSNMVMYPELNLGVFISINVVGSDSNVVDFLPDLILRNFYRPYPTKSPQKAKPPISQYMFSEQDLEKYTGRWLNTRRSYSQLEKLSALSKSVTISLGERGDLVMKSFDGQLTLREISSGVFKGLSRDAPIFYFYQGPNGDVERFSASMWSADYERVSFIQSPDFFYVTLALSSLISLATLLLGFIRSRRGRHFSLFEKLASFSATTILFVVLGFILIDSGLVFDQYAINLDFPSIHVKVVLWLVLITLVTTSVMIVSLPLVWRAKDLGWFDKLHYLVFTASSLNFLYVFWLWNAIGFNYYS